MTKVFAAMGIFMVAITAAVPLAIANGWLVSTVWNWIAVPAFHAPHLSIPAAIALTMLVGMFHNGVPPDDKRPASYFLMFAGARFVTTLLGAWILKGFV